MQIKIKQLISKLFSTQFVVGASAVTTALYFALKTHLFYNLGSPVGDEICFLEAHDLIEKNGLFNELTKGKISPLFSIISTCLNYFIQDILITYRTISFLATLATLYLVFRFAKNKLEVKGYYLMGILILSFSFLGFRIYWQGLNDSIFHLCIVLAFYILYKIQFQNKATKYYILVGIIFGLMIGTRFLSFVVIPCFIFFFSNSIRNILITGTATLLVGLVFHIPSLSSGNGFADQDKEPKNGMTWAQKNYVSQKLIYEKKLNEGRRVTWGELENYIKENGKEDLPTKFTETLTKSPKITLNSLYNNVVFSIKKTYLTFLGLGLFLLFYIYYFTFKNKNQITTNLKYCRNFTSSFWLHTALISLVSFTQIEPRWYTAFIYLAIVITHYLFQSLKTGSEEKKLLFFKINLILISVFQLQFILTDNNYLSAILRQLL